MVELKNYLLNRIQLWIEFSMVWVGQGVWSDVVSRLVEMFWRGVFLRIVWHLHRCSEYLCLWVGFPRSSFGAAWCFTNARTPVKFSTSGLSICTFKNCWCFSLCTTGSVRRLEHKCTNDLGLGSLNKEDMNGLSGIDSVCEGTGKAFVSTSCLLTTTAVNVRVCVSVCAAHE